MKNTLLIGIILIALLFITCKSQKVNSEKKESLTTYFIIGSGGGFTGEYNKYKVYSDGTVEKFDYDKELFHEYTSIDDKLVTQYFVDLNSMKLIERKLNSPGNMTYFIEQPIAESMHVLKWGGNNQKVDEDLLKFFDAVMTEILKIERKE